MAMTHHLDYLNYIYMYEKIAKDKGYPIIAAWMATDMAVMTVTLFPTVFIPLGLHWLLCGLS